MCRAVLESVRDLVGRRPGDFHTPLVVPPSLGPGPGRAPSAGQEAPLAGVLPSVQPTMPTGAASCCLGRILKMQVTCHL